MSRRALMPTASAADWSPPSLPRRILQRATGQHPASDVLAAGAPLGARGDFSRVPARVAKPGGAFSDDVVTAVPEAEAPAPESNRDGSGSAPDPQQLGDGNADAQPAQSAPVNGKVTSLDLITGSSGAVTGFPAITGGGSLDTPGAFNDTTTGACKNIHQMKFTVTGIPSSELRLLRTITRTSSLAGVQQQYSGNDGPSPATVLRPSTTLVAVADSPGYKGASTSSHFPITYNADFKLYGFDIVSTAILAELHYTVTIAKSSLGDAKPTNTIAVTKKVLK